MLYQPLKVKTTARRRIRNNRFPTTTTTTPSIFWKKNPSSYAPLLAASHPPFSLVFIPHSASSIFIIKKKLVIIRSTLWKWHNFLVTLILREINFNDSRSATFAHFNTFKGSSERPSRVGSAESSANFGRAGSAEPLVKLAEPPSTILTQKIINYSKFLSIFYQINFKPNKIWGFQLHFLLVNF